MNLPYNNSVFDVLAALHDVENNGACTIVRLLYVPFNRDNDWCNHADCMGLNKAKTEFKCSCGIHCQVKAWPDDFEFDDDWDVAQDFDKHKARYTALLQGYLDRHPSHETDGDDDTENETFGKSDDKTSSQTGQTGSTKTASKVDDALPNGDLVQPLVTDCGPWTEKYRPAALKQVISQDAVLTTLKTFMKAGRLPHLLFYGPPGTGKTSTVLAMAREMCGAQYPHLVLELNASDDRRIDVVRKSIKTFASTALTAGMKFVILDEADALTIDAQMALRRIIEQYSSKTRFCILVNSIHRIIPALLSRCTRFRFAPLSRTILDQRIVDIAQLEKVTIEPAARRALIDLAQGDMRKILNVFQSCAKAYPIITEAAVYQAAGQATPAEIETIAQCLSTQTMSRAFLDMNRLITERGYSLLEIVRQLGQWVLATVVPSDGKSADAKNANSKNTSLVIPSIACATSLLIELGNCEYRLATGQSKQSNDMIQLAGLVATFQLFR